MFVDAEINTNELTLEFEHDDGPPALRPVVLCFRT